MVTLPQVMALFNFNAGTSIDTHPFRDVDRYNETLRKLSDILGLPVAVEYTGCEHPTGKMPFLMARKKIIETDVLCIEMLAPMMAAFNHIPEDSLSINPRLIYHVYKARYSVKQFVKCGVSVDDMLNIQQNMKLFTNMAYGRVDGRSSILRSAAGVDVRKLISDFFYKMIHIIIHDVPLSELLYFDGDAIFVKYNEKTYSKIKDAISFIVLHYGIQCEVKRHENLIIPVAKQVITFKGSIFDLRVSGYEVDECT